MIGKLSPSLRVVAGLLYIFLLAPILVVIPLSFSADSYLKFPPSGWSLRWYEAMFSLPAMVNAFYVSLALAALVTVLSLVVGVPAAIALRRADMPGRDFLLNLFTAPLLLPSIVLGLAILLVFVQLHLLGTMPGLIVAHLIVTTPYTIRVITTALTTLPPSVEEAATMLGASPLAVFRRITLPLIKPGMIASGALSFLLSFDEVVLSLFITGPRLTTLPVQIFNYVDSHADPLVAAISVALIVITVGIIALIERTVGLTRAIAK